MRNRNSPMHHMHANVLGAINFKIIFGKEIEPVYMVLCAAGRRRMLKEEDHDQAEKEVEKEEIEENEERGRRNNEEKVIEKLTDNVLISNSRSYQADHMTVEHTK